MQMLMLSQPSYKYYHVVFYVLCFQNNLLESTEISGINLLDFMSNLLHFHSNIELKWLA